MEELENSEPYFFQVALHSSPVHLWPETIIGNPSTLRGQSTTNMSSTFRFLLIKRMFWRF